MKRVNSIRVFIVVVTALMVNMMSCGGNQTTKKTNTQTTGKELLEKYDTCQPVKPEDNKIGITIESISKEEGNSFLVQWKCTSDLIMKNPMGHQLVAMYLYFIDPDDPQNIKNGLASEFRGNLGCLDKMIVTLDKPVKSLIIYFEGVSSSIPNSEELRTVPLFFMAELGDNPKLLDKLPRYAGDLFKQIVEKAEKNDENQRAKTQTK